MTEGQAEGAPERVPLPYLPFDTYRNFLEGLSGRPLPPRIDRSLMAGMSGGTQTLLLATLGLFGLIGEDRQVLAPFREMVAAGDDERRSLTAVLLQRTYPEAMALATHHATADQLAESFRAASGYQGSTLRKAVTFYLNMARYAQVELSPFFRAPAQVTGARKTSSRRGRPPRSAPSPAQAPAETLTAPAAAAESRSLELRSGGTVSISCSVSFLSLSRPDREFVFDLVDRIDGYSESMKTRSGHSAPNGVVRDDELDEARPGP